MTNAGDSHTCSIQKEKLKTKAKLQKSKELLDIEGLIKTANEY